eukprot:CAMPEP_0115045618 /NCGR_PEP_ID=MMETSP0216-20121206/48251_1 /TAXON_ID=223996 /ORGANISM="Protocruzia adherens, Strain Boccale" /LENGTH=155 /DNA_ID=CAMNT_0002428523 /DNA_START=90 /DNA_END=554 /DNA_ORIENTATION=-
MVLATDESRAFLIWDDIRVERQDAYNEAKEVVEVENQKTENISKQTENINDWLIWVLFEAKGKDQSLLTPSTFADMERLNLKIQAHSPSTFADMERLNLKIQAHDRYSKVCLISGADSKCHIDDRSPLGFYPQRSTQSEIDQRTDAILADEDEYL